MAVIQARNVRGRMISGGAMSSGVVLSGVHGVLCGEGERNEYPGVQASTHQLFNRPISSP